MGKVEWLNHSHRQVKKKMPQIPFWEAQNDIPYIYMTHYHVTLSIFILQGIEDIDTSSVATSAVEPSISIVPTDLESAVDDIITSSSTSTDSSSSTQSTINANTDFLLRHQVSGNSATLPQTHGSTRLAADITDQSHLNTTSSSLGHTFRCPTLSLIPIQKQIMWNKGPIIQCQGLF